MSDLATMLWKEFSEFASGRRAWRVFAIAVLVMGGLPLLESAHMRTATLALIMPFYVLFATVIVTAQTAPDLVLRERNGHTLEHLLATRLPDGAIFGGKVLTSAALGYAAAMLAMLIQVIALNEIGRAGGSPLAYLADPVVRLAVLAGPAVLAVYLSVVGTFVALRVGDQRSAYLVTMLCVAVLALPFILHLLTLQANVPSLQRLILGLAVLDAILLRIGIRLFRRERLILYLQE